MVFRLVRRGRMDLQLPVEHIELCQMVLLGKFVIRVVSVKSSWLSLFPEKAVEPSLLSGVQGDVTPFTRRC